MNTIDDKTKTEIRQGLANLTKDDLARFFFRPIQQYIIRDAFRSTKSFYDRWIRANKQPKKEELIEIIIDFYTDKDTVTDYMTGLSPRDKKILHKAVWQQTLTKDELEEICEKPVLYETKNSVAISGDLKAVWENYLHLQYSSFFRYDASNKADLYDLTLTFPRLLSLLFSISMEKPEGYYLTPCEKAPENTTVINREQDIISEIPLILSFLMQGNLKFTNKGYLVHSSAKKMSKSLNINEFDNDKVYSYRSLLLAGMVKSIDIKKVIAQTPLQAIKTIFSQDLYQINLPTFSLPHIKGTSRIDRYHFTRALTKDFFDVLKLIPQGEWITFSNLRNYFEGRFIPLRPINSYELERLLVAVRIPGNKEDSFNEELINNRNAKVVADIPYLAAHIYLLAAWGIMEIAVNDKKWVYSPAETLEAFRLTPMGEYLFGRTEHYIIAKSENDVNLSFDDSSLLIRADGNARLVDTILENYAVKLTENRYQFSAGKFLKDCSTTYDLENKIQVFRQMIGKELPLFWEEYFKKLRANSQAVRQMKKLVTLALPAGDKELHRLVAQDEQLKKLAVKAEKFIVLIEESEYLLFYNKLKEYGYLLPPPKGSKE